uniref:Uncharacterized protein n=1 Tax=Arundo donax TaxID=35708 RepID=A0A0A8YBV2_ARUDO
MRGIWINTARGTITKVQSFVM